MSETVIIAIIGVAGTLIGSIIGLFGNSILERRRVKNDGRIHITKAQFDMQMGIYRELSKAFFHVLVIMNTFSATYSKNSSQKLPNEKQWCCKILRFAVLARQVPLLLWHLFCYKEADELWIFCIRYQQYLLRRCL